MSYTDFGRSKLRHNTELAKLLQNPNYTVFVPVGMYSDFVGDKLYMVCMNGHVNDGIWLTKDEGNRFDKRISAAIDRHLNEILYDLLPEEDSEFGFQNEFAIREVPEAECWD